MMKKMVEKNPERNFTHLRYLQPWLRLSHESAEVRLKIQPQVPKFRGHLHLAFYRTQNIYFKIKQIFKIEVRKSRSKILKSEKIIKRGKRIKS